MLRHVGREGLDALGRPADMRAGVRLLRWFGAAGAKTLAQHDWEVRDLPEIARRVVRQLAE